MIAEQSFIDADDSLYLSGMLCPDSPIKQSLLYLRQHECRNLKTHTHDEIK